MVFCDMGFVRGSKGEFAPLLLFMRIDIVFLKFRRYNKKMYVSHMLLKSYHKRMRKEKEWIVILRRWKGLQDMCSAMPTIGIMERYEDILRRLLRRTGQGS